MKMVGLLERVGFGGVSVLNNHNIYYDQRAILLAPIYQNRDKLYFQYLNCGDIYILLQNLQNINEVEKMDSEIKAFLCGGETHLNHPLHYRKLENKIYYDEVSPITIDPVSYRLLSEFPQKNISIEKGYGFNSKSYIFAAIFPENNVFIGSRRFIYENNIDKFSIAGKNASEICGIISFLRELHYWDDVSWIIEKVEALEKKPDDYTFFEHFFNKEKHLIEKIRYVKEKTAHLNLLYFNL